MDPPRPLKQMKTTLDGIVSKLAIEYHSNSRYGTRVFGQADHSWISTKEIPNQHTHSGLNALLIMVYPFLGGIALMVLCRVLYEIIWSRRTIAMLRWQTGFESTGINMGKGKGKSARDMA